jgi:ATP-dependent exoDNAse (exonuclease V) beta subunit
MTLVVYKSSAGSGKTTTLVNEYLKLTLRNPYDFRHVLAITFTNNAANEMKSRVLYALEKIIDGNARADGELKQLLETIQLEDGDLIKRAKELQKLIIHRYDEFSISTIDAFVHRIVRTFSTDVQLPRNFEVVIDKDDFVPDIVEELFSRVGNDNALTDIMVNFVLSQVDQEKSFDPAAVVTGYVEKQLDEEGFDHLEKLSTLGAAGFAVIIDRLTKKLDVLKKNIMTSGKEAMDAIHANHLEAGDFYQGNRGIYSYFQKCSRLDNAKDVEPNSFVLKTIDEDKWVSGKIAAAAGNTINSVKGELRRYYALIAGMKDEYLLLSIIYRKIYALALAGEIRSIFNEYSHRTQKVHISEFNKRISLTVAEQPVPFLFERLGRKYRYFLIDEFQDTSILQWKNLFPLIEESLSYGHFNMLVGDAKQAIYRFRNGEVELFSSLPDLYAFENDPDMAGRKKLIEDHYEEIPLDMNWRSQSQLIDFNNSFFSAVKQGMNQRIQTIYKGHEQRIPDNDNKKGGFVSIDLLEAEKSGDYDKLRLEKIRENVARLSQHGYHYFEICILTRTNRSATEVASFLLENGYPVVTSESLLVKRAPEVRVIIALLRLMNRPDDAIALADFIRHLLLVRGQDQFHDAYQRISTAKHNGLGWILRQLDMDWDVDNAVNLPVYEIVETIIRELELNRESNIYLQYFLDFVIESQDNGKGNTANFLEHWDRKSQKLFISMTDGGDAIRVMTVHKAKGLKFETVIVDITNRSFKKGRTEFYSPLQHPEFPELDVVLLPLTRELSGIHLEDEYTREEEKTELDFLNLVYVAFTRAVSALMILGHKGSKTNDRFTQLLRLFLESEGLWEEEGEIRYSSGKLASRSSKVKKEDEEKLKLSTFISTSWKDRIRMADADEVYWEAMDSKPARVYGKLIHEMLSQVIYSKDVDRIVDKYKRMFFIDEPEAEQIKEKISEVVSHPSLLPLFNPGAVVMNEQDIVDLSGPNPLFQRPDRVVILPDKWVILDYKTGQKERKHMDQIKRYGQLLVKMGNGKVEKKLVYINEKVEVIEVD